MLLKKNLSEIFFIFITASKFQKTGWVKYDLEYQAEDPGSILGNARPAGSKIAYLLSDSSLGRPHYHPLYQSLGPKDEYSDMGPLEKTQLQRAGVHC